MEYLSQKSFDSVLNSTSGDIIKVWKTDDKYFLSFNDLTYPYYGISKRIYNYIAGGDQDGQDGVVVIKVDQYKKLGRNRKLDNLLA